ncbi:MAG: PhzF family phenazine biosynthesis protein [Pirellulales bacterium]
MIPMLIVDAFAERAFAGNPASVCLLERWPADEWLAKLAAEMNHSETAYLVPEGGDFELRWFTPAVEVDLCGHATLASAAALYHTGRASPTQPIVFHTRSGPLTATRRGDEIELDFPVTPAEPATAPEGLLAALGVSPANVGRSKFDYLVEVAGEDVVRDMTPDFRALLDVECRGVIVTARSSDAEFDFVSRFFAPRAGVDEDPVTGSAHCTLAAYWHERLGKCEFRALQASARGGIVGVRLAGNRVQLGGRATIVLEGTLTTAASPH